MVIDVATGTVALANKEAERIAGILPGDPLAQYHQALDLRRVDGRPFQPDQLPTHRVLELGETVRAEEVVIGRPNGDAITALVSATPIRSPSGEIVSVIVVFQDMTPLEEIERLRSEFLGMVSHELRTPLTTIKGSAATLLGASSALNPDEMRQFFLIIDEQADHMRGLISDLLDVTRIEAGRLSVTPQPTEVAALV